MEQQGWRNKLGLFFFFLFCEGIVVFSFCFFWFFVFPGFLVFFSFDVLGFLIFFPLGVVSLLCFFLPPIVFVDILKEGFAKPIKF